MGPVVKPNHVLLVVLIAALLATGAVMAASLHAEDRLRPEGAVWDEALWSGLILPDSAVVCRLRGDGSAGCVAVPKGTLLLIPTPKDFD